MNLSQALKKQDEMVMRATGENNLLSYKEAAARLCLPERTLQDWVYKRRIPYVKLGSLVRFRPEDLEKLIQDNYVPAKGGKN